MAFALDNRTCTQLNGTTNVTGAPPSPSNGMGCVVLAGSVIVLGGDMGGSRAFRYHISAQAWSAIPTPAEVSRHLVDAYNQDEAVLGDKVYIHLYGEHYEEMCFVVVEAVVVVVVVEVVVVGYCGCLDV